MDEKNSAGTIKIGTPVFHNRYGKGTVSKFSKENVYVQFSIGVRIFPCPQAFEKEYLIPERDEK